LLLKCVQMLSYRSYPSKQTITSWQKGEVGRSTCQAQRASALVADYMSNNGDFSIKNKADDGKAYRIKVTLDLVLCKLNKASPSYEFHCRPNVDKFWKTLEINNRRTFLGHVSQACAFNQSVIFSNFQLEISTAGWRGRRTTLGTKMGQSVFKNLQESFPAFN